MEDAEGIEKNRELGLSLNEGNQTTPIPGLNLGFSRTAHGQMWNGVVNKDFRLRESSNELAICPSNRHFLTFYLYLNKSVDDAVDVAYGKVDTHTALIAAQPLSPPRAPLSCSRLVLNVTLPSSDVRVTVQPELITTSDVSSPILTGSLAGGVVNATHHASFTITFHCHSDGETMYTLTIPLLPLRWPPSTNPRSAIVISFLKACNMTSSANAAEMGGLGIQGFSIGRTEGAAATSYATDSPLPHYFGQKSKDKPEWDDILVPVSELSTSTLLLLLGR